MGGGGGGGFIKLVHILCLYVLVIKEIIQIIVLQTI